MDVFLLRKLNEEGLSFSPLAEKSTIARRLWFDLLGLRV
jgi:hypothetical protein